MIPKRTLLIGMLLFCTTVFVVAYAQEDMTVVDNSVFDAPRRSPAPFEHDAHNEAAEIEECNECHHVYEDGQLLEDESSEDQRCADCHGERGENRKLALTKAFHTNCKGCHLKQKAGPIMCGECHPW